MHLVDPEPLLNPALLDASRLRTPIKLSPEEQERRTLLLKEWSRYKMKQHKEDLQRVQELERCGEEALKELKKSRGGSRIFFRRGCTRLLLYFNTNKPHSFFFGRIPVVLENRRSSQWGGGGAHPLHPTPRSAPT